MIDNKALTNRLLNLLDLLIKEHGYTVGEIAMLFGLLPQQVYKIRQGNRLSINIVNLEFAINILKAKGEYSLCNTIVSALLGFEFEIVA